ncbi:phosphotransferase [Burkholderia sp. 4701]|nr:phosphotransferase [Burkholderia sp. 4701]MXN82674.1 phosphotransferase [Burkholderia sp. 4812]
MTAMNSGENKDLKISFEFRFARDRESHRANLSAHEKLVSKFSEELKGPKIISIELYQVERVGDSGSQVFYVDVYRREMVAPESFVAKFQSLDATVREATGAQNARIVRMCSPYYCYPQVVRDALEADSSGVNRPNFPTGPDAVGMIVYEFTNVKNPREFREAFLDWKTPNEACAEALNALYSRVPDLQKLTDKPVSLVEDFKRYLRPGVAPLSRVKALVTSSVAGMQSIASSIMETFDFIESKFDISIRRVAVHGDLHARNLMIGQEDWWDYGLIDFDWMHYGHPAKDFVILEATLKYMLLPELIRKAKMEDGKALPYLPTKAIELLAGCWYQTGLQVPDKNVIEDALSGDDILQEHLNSIERVNACLRVLRSRAEKCMSEYAEKYPSFPKVSAEQHYYICLFLVTVGLLGYTQTELTWAMIGLSRLGEHLRTTL